MRQRRGAVMSAHVRQHKAPNALLDQSRAETANQIINQESPLAPFILNHRAEHPHREHIKEEVAEVRMKEHVRQRLPQMKSGSGKIMQACNVIEVNTIALNHRGQQINNTVRY